MWLYMYILVLRTAYDVCAPIESYAPYLNFSLTLELISYSTVVGTKSELLNIGLFVRYL